MDEVQKNLAQAWMRIAPILARDPPELRRRLARRRSALLQSPPRAWCLAVRATDTRLDRYCTSRPDRWRNTDEGHQVLLDRPALRKLCAPVYLPRPGLPVGKLAQLLGTTPHGLLNARLNGIFQTHFVDGLGGHFGKPSPILYTNRPLDPSARSFASPDPAWSGTAENLLARVPDDIEFLLTRIPLYQSIGLNYDDADELHPEDPALDPPTERPARRNRTLADVDASGRRDYVWYKWKGDQYVGHDWRNPVAAANHHQRQRQLAQTRTRVNQRRREQGPALSLSKGPSLSFSKGSLHFRGWRWLCPGCRRKVNLLFYPLPRIHLLPLPLPPSLRRSVASSLPPEPLPTFACEKCHRIKRTSRADPNSWNELVTYLSGGLLFGHEVQRPPWYPRGVRADRRDADDEFAQRGIEGRKIDFTPRPNARPSLRRPQIEQMLLAGRSFREIASDLLIGYGTVLWHAQQVYKQHGVRSLPELLRKHGITPKLKKREEVRQRLARGQPVAQIAREMGISRMSVYNHVYMLRRSGKILPRSGVPARQIALSADSTSLADFGRSVLSS